MGRRRIAYLAGLFVFQFLPIKLTPLSPLKRPLCVGWYVVAGGVIQRSPAETGHEQLAIFVGDEMGGHVECGVSGV